MTDNQFNWFGRAEKGVHTFITCSVLIESVIMNSLTVHTREPVFIDVPLLSKRISGERTLKPSHRKRMYGDGRGFLRDFRILPTRALHSHASTFVRRNSIRRVWLIDDRRTLLCVYRDRSGPKSLTGGRNTRRFSRKILGTVHGIYSPTSRRRCR